MKVLTGVSGVMQAALIKQRSLAEQALLSAGLAIVPALLRLVIDPDPGTMPFLVFWPTVLLSALLLEPWFAALAVIGSFALALMLFVRPLAQMAWTGQLLVSLVLALCCVVLAMTMAIVARTTVRELHSVTRQQDSFNRELRHRTRNLLAIIQALSARGPRAENPLDFFREFSDRLESLAKASDLLRIGTEAEGHLPELIERTIAPFSLGSRIRLSGTACVVPDQSCIPLIMAVHELCTNAIKHGALSGPAGWVDLRWFLAPDGNRLYLLWKETGGPLVAPPAHEGTGSHLLRAQPGLEAVDLMFDPKGVWCEMLIVGARATAEHEMA
ncbi:MULTISPECIES: sensor histidine kinase [unclassified Novosphingobium]|uniref:sensor histidine kinase n=1 Tax=Novosphingobium TaxID=165696 RepID=UPI001447728F|nr:MULTISPECIES: sensor histidine kinase [unclassified Novosphingobium]NKJ43847.1 two-component sensor histidine kinase [Novosphingobium sp. SG720]NMN06310.1 two-component sensor histidine kinase [Novosphingobium sp. SG919]NMN88608.1 two-component sensor histidine kinase [Novosphingobium sp. SG916]